MRCDSIGIVSIAAFVCIASIAGAGTLTPPAGPVAPTPGPEARIPVNAQTCPGDNDATPSTFRITQSGSYYLTGNIAGEAGKHGIEIEAYRVTLDLNGYHVVGVNLSKTGILVRGVSGQCEIRNGTVSGFYGDGIGYEGAPNYTKVIGVLATSNFGTGISIGAYSLVRDSEAFNNGADGIRIYSAGRADNCQANGNTRYGFNVANSGNIVSRCISNNNGDDGFNSSTNNTFIECGSNSNFGDGLNVDRAVLRGCHATSNAGYGIYASTGSHISDCQASANGLSGFDARAGSVLINNGAYNNANASPGHYGFLIGGQGVRATGNHASGNGNGFGVLSNNRVVTGNTAINSAGTGFSVQANANCVLTGNVATGNLTNYSIGAGNDTGALITNPGVGFVSTNPTANIAN